jgi:hypothetical protein
VGWKFKPVFMKHLMVRVRCVELALTNQLLSLCYINCTGRRQGIEISAGSAEGCRREVDIQHSGTIHLARAYYTIDSDVIRCS